VRTAEEQHLKHLYEAHAVRALRFAYVLTGAREVAEDLMQEAFIRAFDRLDTL
jgi:DNA-directed RNA polymerase specialized sigma24 family protein